MVTMGKKYQVLSPLCFRKTGRLVVPEKGKPLPVVDESEFDDSIEWLLARGMICEEGAEVTVSEVVPPKKKGG
jgi:hypothetical protein